MFPEISTKVGKVILCCGDREWNAWEPIWRELRTVGHCLVVHGAARGADRMCGSVAEQLGYPTDPVPANWQQYGKAAGMIRNRWMLKKHPEIELVIAFHADLAHSKGTKDMVTLAESKGISVTRVER